MRAKPIEAFLAAENLSSVRRSIYQVVKEEYQIHKKRNKRKREGAGSAADAEDSRPTKLAKSALNWNLLRNSSQGQAVTWPRRSILRVYMRRSIYEIARRLIVPDLNARIMNVTDGEWLKNKEVSKL